MPKNRYREREKDPEALSNDLKSNYEREHQRRLDQRWKKQKEEIELKEERKSRTKERSRGMF